MRTWVRLLYVFYSSDESWGVNRNGELSQRTWKFSLPLPRLASPINFDLSLFLDRSA